MVREVKELTAERTILSRNLHRRRARDMQALPTIDEQLACDSLENLSIHDQEEHVDTNNQEGNDQEDKIAEAARKGKAEQVVNRITRDFDSTFLNTFQEKFQVDPKSMVFVVQKFVADEDIMDPNYATLSINFKGVESTFFSEEELAEIRRKKSKRVYLIEGDHSIDVATLRQLYDGPSSSIYELNYDWIDDEEHSRFSLKNMAGSQVQIWAFRFSSGLIGIALLEKMQDLGNSSRASSSRVCKTESDDNQDSSDTLVS